MTIFELLKNTTQCLSEGNVDSPRAEAEIIIAELMKTTRPNLFILAEKTAPKSICSQTQAIVKRRIAGEPLQYIQEIAYFMNITLKVGPEVLIPRPETELLVERVCRETPAHGRVCDIGTGSGAIALAVAFERPDLEVVGLDISIASLEIAELNRVSCKLQNVTFMHSDLLAALPADYMPFDYIAANLPYISQTEYEQLPVEVKEYEPEGALLADDYGLAVIKRAALQMPAFMNDAGRTIFEIGATQGNRLKKFLNSTACFKNIEIIKDLNQLDRFVICTKQ